MDLDLNQQPLELDTPPHASLLNESEPAGHGRIEERIRHLKQVALRARWRQDHTTPATVSEVRVMEKGKFRQSTVLIADALRMVGETKKAESDHKGGNIYDCNICLETAKEPILTCCGHLFCWSCFYLLSYCHSNVKECPACKGEVKDTSIVPIYGTNGSEESRQRSKGSTLKVGPRPQAQRVESVRQLASDE